MEDNEDRVGEEEVSVGGEEEEDDDEWVSERMWTLIEGSVGRMSWALVNEWRFPFFLWKKMSVKVSRDPTKRSNSLERWWIQTVMIHNFLSTAQKAILRSHSSNHDQESLMWVAFMGLCNGLVKLGKKKKEIQL